MILSNIECIRFYSIVEMWSVVVVVRGRGNGGGSCSGSGGGGGGDSFN